MKRNFIFVFILLATLPIVNAIPYQLHKRVTTFMPCHGKPPVNPLVVKVFPEPLIPGEDGIFDIHGKLAKPAVTGSTLVIGFYNIHKKLIDKPFKLYVCSIPGANCPEPSFDASGPVPIPPKLPRKYKILVTVFDADGKTAIGCAVSLVCDSGGSEYHHHDDDCASSAPAGSSAHASRWHK